MFRSGIFPPPTRSLLFKVERGVNYVSPRVQEMSSSAPPQVRLTTKQTSVVQMVAHGLTSKEIADRLSISTKTVQEHRQTLMMKLNVRSVAALTMSAVRLGLVCPWESPRLSAWWISLGWFLWHSAGSMADLD